MTNTTFVKDFIKKRIEAIREKIKERYPGYKPDFSEYLKANKEFFAPFMEETPKLHILSVKGSREEIESQVHDHYVQVYSAEIVEHGYKSKISYGFTLFYRPFLEELTDSEKEYKIQLPNFAKALELSEQAGYLEFPYADYSLQVINKKTIKVIPLLGMNSIAEGSIEIISCIGDTTED
ncbi:MAG: hypothetical protein PHC66_01995 [Candidatus Nanoarchaeia archaeon]|nr:hypothetical protein [Candidatus Nanoarchaeia archaeon]MDD5239060.1 hypothetical protein [Candidatus Nanoarchaeia archaeon]